MIALGIDLGGTKIAAQIFDAAWNDCAQMRLPTPRDYAGLLAALGDLVQWADAQAGRALPIGIGAAGVVRPATGVVLAANLAADGRALPRDLARALGRDVTYLNDARALALSETVFGAARGYGHVYALVLGTGVGGGQVQCGRVAAGTSGLGGEIGHLPAPADLVARYDLPLFDCACGRRGCMETYLGGAGLARLATALTGQTRSAPDIAAARHDDTAMAQVWAVWCAFCADLLRQIMLVADPDCIVLGGGMSQIAGLAADLTAALGAVQYDGFTCPAIQAAQGGAISGARGAAYAAHQGAGHG